MYLRHGILNKAGSLRCLKIHTALDEGAVQSGLIREAPRDVVVFQIAPAELCPEPARYLEFEAALHLVAPILA